jgi:cysteine dioxygenase
MEIEVAQLVGRLERIPEADFTLGNVEDLLRGTSVETRSPSPYLHFASTHYTRNLIHRCDRFELMAICWEVGQASRIHNHAGQNCWMAVPIGRLDVQNYELASLDATTGHCDLIESDRWVMDSLHPCHVRPEAPIHAVLNPASYAQRAVSLHVYSRPYDRCVVYSLAEKRCMEVPLFFDTEYGRPVRVPAE